MFSTGIIVLAVLSALLLIVFDGVTERLIPLFAIGAFGAFLFSQAGMVRHWLRKGGRNVHVKLFFNGLGAITTAVVLVIIILAKFKEGAWMTVVVAPALILLLRKIHLHYERIGQQLDKPLKLQAAKLQPPIVIIPIKGWNRITEKAVRFGLSLSDDVMALHISTEKDDDQHLRELWTKSVEEPAKAMNATVPRLHIIDSPYRRISKLVIAFITEMAQEQPDRLIAVMIPELIEPHWYKYLLRNLQAIWLKTLLYLKGNERTIVMNCPWYFR